MRQRSRLAGLLGLLIVLAHGAVGAQTDPLPSWSDGEVKQAIVKFVTAVTESGGPQYVPPAQRIATFDMTARSGRSSRSASSSDSRWTGCGRWRRSIPSGRRSSRSRASWSTT